MEDRYKRRAGLDDHEYQRATPRIVVCVFIQPPAERMFAMTTKSSDRAFTQSYCAGDWLMCGNEIAGLPEAVHDSFATTQRQKLPHKLAPTVGASA